MAFNKNVCTSLDAVQCNGTMQPAEEGYLLFKKPDVSRDEKDPSHNTKLLTHEGCQRCLDILI
jgi:hypothetical protein